MNAGLSLEALTIGQVLADKAAKNGDRNFLTFTKDGRSFSYKDLESVTHRIANGLAARGLRHGAHVAVMMENSPEALFTYFALGKIGAVAVPINTNARGQQLAYFLQQSDSVALIADDKFVDRFEEHLPGLPAIGQVVLKSAAPVAATMGGKACSDFADLLGAEPRPVAGKVTFSDLSYLLYTSGTTGPSKANMFCHAHSVMYGMDVAHSFGYGADDVIYVCLSMAHATALHHQIYCALMADAQVVLAERFSASNFWNDIRQYGVTSTVTMGAMANFLWNAPRTDLDAANKLRMVMMAPVPKFGTEFEDRFGVKIVSAYGLTDYASSTAFTLSDDRAKLGSSGRPRRGMQVAIVDDNDIPLPAGQVGEIVLRSDIPWHASLGYYKMPDATLSAWRNLWFHSGDRGYLDADGYLHFVDRKKDAIRRRGENISSFEIEQVIISHPAVQDVAAFPVASEASEDEVAVAVVAQPGMSVSAEEIVAFCTTRMAHFMVPRYVLLKDNLPRTANEKVQKFVLRTEAEQNLKALWDRERIAS